MGRWHNEREDVSRLWNKTKRKSRDFLRPVHPGPDDGGPAVRAEDIPRAKAARGEGVQLPAQDRARDPAAEAAQGLLFDLGQVGREDEQGRHGVLEANWAVALHGVQ